MSTAIFERENWWFRRRMRQSWQVFSSASAAAATGPTRNSKPYGSRMAKDDNTKFDPSQRHPPVKAAR